MSVEVLAGPDGDVGDYAPARALKAGRQRLRPREISPSHAGGTFPLRISATAPRSPACPADPSGAFSRSSLNPTRGAGSPSGVPGLPSRGQNRGTRGACAPREGRTAIAQGPYPKPEGSPQERVGATAPTEGRQIFRRDGTKNQRAIRPLRWAIPENERARAQNQSERSGKVRSDQAIFEQRGRRR